MELILALTANQFTTAFLPAPDSLAYEPLPLGPTIGVFHEFTDGSTGSGFKMSWRQFAGLLL